MRKRRRRSADEEEEGADDEEEEDDEREGDNSRPKRASYRPKSATTSSRRRMDVEDERIPPLSHFRFRNPFHLEMGELKLVRIQIRCHCDDEKKKGKCQSIKEP